MNTWNLNVEYVSLDGIIFNTDYIFHEINPETDDITYSKKNNLFLKIFDGISFSSSSNFDLTFISQIPNTNLFKYKLTSYLFNQETLIMFEILNKTDTTINDNSNKISVDFFQNYVNGLEVPLDVDELGSYKINSLMINENIIPVNSDGFTLYSLPESANIQIVANKDYLIPYSGAKITAKITLNGGAQTGGHEIVLSTVKNN